MGATCCANNQTQAGSDEVIAQYEKVQLSQRNSIEFKQIEPTTLTAEQRLISMHNSIIKLQSYSRGYLARKDISAELAADNTNSEVYFNQTVDEMAIKLGSYSAQCPKT